MKIINKFYDPQIAEPAAQPSVAQLMATQGVKVEPGSDVVVPTVTYNTEKKEEPQVLEPTPAATATATQTTEPANPEPPKQTEEPIAVPEPQKAAEPVKAPSLQEVLRNQQPDTVLKELGFDDKVIGFINGIKELDPKMVAFLTTWKSGGDLTGYVREMTTDYSKMNAEDVMRHQLRQDYPKASDPQLNILFKSKVVNAYNLDSDDEELKAEGQLLLEAEAERHREKLVENQQNYLLPKAPEPKAPEPDKSEVEAQQKFEQYRSQFDNSSYTKDIFTSKQISFGEGEEKFNYPVDPEALKGILFSGEQWFDKMSVVTNNPDGTKSYAPDARKQMLVAAIAEYGEDFLIQYAKHYKSLGEKTVVETLENAKPVDTNSTSTSEKPPATVAEAMARQGRVNFGGYQ